MAKLKELQLELSKQNLKTDEELEAERIDKERREQESIKLCL